MPDFNVKYERLRRILGLLRGRREELLSLFLEKDSELVGLSFKYEGSQAAFNLVRDYFYARWIDGHITSVMNGDMPDEAKRKALSLISELAGEKCSQQDDPAINHYLLRQRMRGLVGLLSIEDVAAIKRSEVEYSYDKEKALFEREFKRYEKELRDGG